MKSSPAKKVTKKSAKKLEDSSMKKVKGGNIVKGTTLKYNSKYVDSRNTPS